MALVNLVKRVIENTISPIHKIKDRLEQLMSTAANTIGVSSIQANNNTDKDTVICGFNLRGRCNFGNSCFHRHTELPCLWESAAQGDDTWESFSSDLKMTLERACFDVKNDISETVTVKGSFTMSVFKT